jgi:hypothetical protein
MVLKNIKYKNTIIVSKVNLLRYLQHIFFILIIVILFKFIFLPISADLNNYIKYLVIIKNQTFSDALNETRFEPLSTLLFWLMSKVFAPYALLLLLGIILLYIKYLIFLNKLHWPIYAFIWYLPTLGYLHDASQFRTAIASIFIILNMLSLNEIHKSRNLVMLAIGIGFHYVGTVSFIFHISRKLIFLFVLIASVWIFKHYYIDLIINFTLLKFWFVNTSHYTSSLKNPLFILQLFSVILLLFYWRELNAVQKKSATLLIFGAAIYLIFLDNPVVSHRIREISQLGIIGVVFVQSRWSVIPRTTLRLVALFFFLYSINYLIGN